MNSSFWKNKRVYITGHTGFKGSWLSLILQEWGAIVHGFSLKPPTTPSLHHILNNSTFMSETISDIRNRESFTKDILSFEPDIVLHLAAQPLVRYSYDEPLETYEVNVMGTANLLNALRSCPSVKSCVIVTTDKCYENNEWDWGYRENEPMGGYDPYSSSKGCAELVTSAYRRSYFADEGTVNVASARAGNVIGGGDWAKDRLVPDILKSMQNGVPVDIRYPHAIRPWQHVVEPLSGYLLLAEKLYNDNRYEGAWNFGPNDEDAKPVEWIANEMVSLWGEKSSWQKDSKQHSHEANYLKLDCSKAKNALSWQPVWGLNQALERIVSWHKEWISGTNMREHSLRDINAFFDKATYYE